MSLSGKRILLVIGGGIAAYKSLELIRRLRENGCGVRVILTDAGARFVTPLSLASLSGDTVYRDLFDLTDESEMGHLALSRSADLVVVAPATADLMAKLAQGLAPDLASTALLATDKKVLLAPTMNVRMWHHHATQRNLSTLKADGVRIVGPNEGDMACGEYGLGRMAEPHEIIAAIDALLSPARPLAGLKALVTAGPTFEPIDPVRYLANRSSGKQGYAIAAALADAGAATVLVSGPVALAKPAGVALVQIETAQQMWAACEAALPADIAICAAAVADWRPSRPDSRKLKKSEADAQLALTTNPDILASLARHPAHRPALVVGFAAETDNLLAHADAKRIAKGADWIVANDVTGGVMGGDRNQIHLLTPQGTEAWPDMTKIEVAHALAARVTAHFGRQAS